MGTDGTAAPEVPLRFSAGSITNTLLKAFCRDWGCSHELCWPFLCPTPWNLSLRAASTCLMKSHWCLCSSCTEWGVAGYLHGSRNAWSFSGPRKIKSPATPIMKNEVLLPAICSELCLIVCLFYFFFFSNLLKLGSDYFASKAFARKEANSLFIFFFYFPKKQMYGGTSLPVLWRAWHMRKQVSLGQLELQAGSRRWKKEYCLCQK